MADAVDQAHIIQRQYIGPHKMKDQKHFCGPATYAANGRELGNDGVVCHVGPRLFLHLAFAEMRGQVLQVLNFAGA